MGKSIYLVKDSYPDYTKNKQKTTCYNSRRRKQHPKKLGQNINEYFTKEGTQMFIKHMKQYSTSLATKLMLIKTSRYFFILSRMAIIRKTDNYKCWQGCVETGTFIYF